LAVRIAINRSAHGTLPENWSHLLTDRTFTGRDPATFNFQNILYKKQGGRATVTFNRPEVLNAINYGVLSELKVAFKDASWDDRIGVLILTGHSVQAQT
jgi:1,4-dihydroxy-2-naphthoyl-CoA synthase